MTGLRDHGQGGKAAEPQRFRNFCVPPMPSVYLDAKAVPLPVGHGTESSCGYQTLISRILCDSSLLHLLLPLWRGDSGALSDLAHHPLPPHLPAFLLCAFCR